MSDLIPLYKSKPPFMPIVNGFGYMGVVLWDGIEDKVQCHICGKLFTNLPQHLSKHKITVAEYKEEFGLNKRTPLVGLNYSRKRSEISKKAYKKVRKKINLFKKGEKHPNPRPQRIQEMNKFGTCPLQIDMRFDKIKPKKKEDLPISLFMAIRRRFGTYNNYLRYRGFKVKKKWRISKKELFEEIEIFEKSYKKLPFISDIEKGLLLSIKSKRTIYRLFKKWDDCLKEYKLYKVGKNNLTN